MAHMSDISLQQLEGMAKDILALLPSLPPQHYDSVAPRLMQLRNEMQSAVTNAAAGQAVSDNDNDICKPDNVHALTSIKGIDDARAEALKAMGYHSLAQIAALQSDQVAAISQQLNLADDINQQNWIEQAALLLSGAQSAYVQAKEKGQLVSRLAPMPPYREQSEALPIPKRRERSQVSSVNLADSNKADNQNDLESNDDIAPPRMQDPVAAPASQAPAPSQDDASIANEEAELSKPHQDQGQDQSQEDQLTYIKTISPASAAALKLHGITRFADIANWRAEDIERISSILNIGDQIQRENWIEQAAILTQGGETHYAHLASLQAEPASQPDAPSKQRIPEPPDQPDPPPEPPADEVGEVETEEVAAGDVGTDATETGETGSGATDREQDIDIATRSTPHPAIDAMSAAAAAIAAVSGAEQTEQENSYPQHEADARPGTRSSAEQISSQISSAAINTAPAIDAARAPKGESEGDAEGYPKHEGELKLEGEPKLGPEPERETRPDRERADPPRQSPAHSHEQHRTGDPQTEPAQSSNASDAYSEEPQIKTPPSESPPHGQAPASARPKQISPAPETDRFVPRTTLSDLESLEPTPIPQPQHDHAASAAAASGQKKSGFPSFRDFQENGTASHRAKQSPHAQDDTPGQNKPEGLAQRFLPRFLRRMTKPERKKS